MLAPKVEMLAPVAVSLSTTYLGGKCLYVGTNAGSVIVRIFEARSTSPLIVVPGKEFSWSEV